MVPANTPALRFQRAELREKAWLSDAGLACLATAAGPIELIAALGATSAPDAVNALAQILPHRQAVWWACLAVRLIPDLAQRPAERAAIEGAEGWVQSSDPALAARALALAEACETNSPAHWAAMAAYWSGPSLAPADQRPVPPAAHLPGAAVRTTLLLLPGDRSIARRIDSADLLGIGLALMSGDLGRTAQAALRDRLAGVQ